MNRTEVRELIKVYDQLYALRIMMSNLYLTTEDMNKFLDGIEEKVRGELGRVFMEVLEDEKEEKIKKTPKKSKSSWHGYTKGELGTKE